MLRKLNVDGVAERSILVEEGEVLELIAQGLAQLAQGDVAKVIAAAMEKARGPRRTLVG